MPPGLDRKHKSEKIWWTVFQCCLPENGQNAKPQKIGGFRGLKAHVGQRVNFAFMPPEMTLF